MTSRRRRKGNGFSKVVVRFRPLIENEKGLGHVKGIPREPNMEEFTIDHVVNNRQRSNPFKFKNIISEKERNIEVFENCIQPMLKGEHFGTLCVFAYGHSGSGKTHSVIGYGDEKGLFQLSIEELIRLFGSNEDHYLNITFAEIHNDKVSDLLNKRSELKLRDDGKGNIEIRGDVEYNKETGNVRVNRMKSAVVRDTLKALNIMQYGIKKRAVGSSTTHDQSSRSHAILSVTIVTPTLMKLQERLIVQESEIVPFGKRRDDLAMLIAFKGHKMIDKRWTYVGYEDEVVDKKKIEELNAVVDEKQKIIDDLRQEIKEYLEERIRNNSMVGSQLLFVDLAGSDYENVVMSKLSQEEKKESRMINLSLLSLKECIRGISSRKKHIPYRNSRLTMLMKRYLERKKCKVLMICNCSPSEDQTQATLNTLKYAKLFSQF